MYMRIKNFTFLVLVGLLGLFTTNIFAQTDASITPEEIKYWVGDGDKEVIFITNWADPDTALAWGYRYYAETLYVKDVMDAIAEADYRFAYETGGWGVTQITFNDGVLDLALVGGWWMYNVNGVTAGLGYDAQPVNNGDVIKFGDESCGVLVDPENYVYVWTKEVAPVYALGEEAMIDFSEILYWIGEGENEVVFAVNWADPDVCYAWGYRFSTNDVLISQMMDDIAAADGRFDYQGGSGMVYEITFDDGDQHLALVGNYWMYNINGGMAWYGYDEQTVVKGDFVKFGDESCGTEIAPWTLVWETPVQPVPVYFNAVAENAGTSLSLYPNPASSYTTLDLQGMEQAVVTVSDLQGRVLSTFAVTSGEEPVRIETAGYKAGMYLVTVSDGMSRQTMKLTVQ